MPYSNGTGAIRPGGEPSTRHQAWGWREHPPRQRARRSGVRGCRMRTFLRLLMQVTQHIGRHREKGQFRQSASDCRPSRAGQIVVRPDAGRSANRDRRHRGTSGAGSWLDPRVSRQARLQSRCSIVDCFCADQNLPIKTTGRVSGQGVAWEAQGDGPDVTCVSGSTCLCLPGWTPLARIFSGPLDDPHHAFSHVQLFPATVILPGQNRDQGSARQPSRSGVGCGRRDPVWPVDGRLNGGGTPRSAG